MSCPPRLIARELTMQPTIRNRKLSPAAAAVTALGLFSSPNVYAQPPLPLAPAQGCTFPGDSFTVNRADGALLVVGSQAGGVELGPRATYDSGDHRIIGNVTRGAINGSKVDF